MASLVLTSSFAFPALVTQCKACPYVTNVQVYEEKQIVFVRCPNDELACLAERLAEFLLVSWLPEKLIAEQTDAPTRLTNADVRACVCKVVNEWRRGADIAEGYRYANWLERSRRSLYGIIAVNHRLSVDGFGHFRLRPLTSVLREVVEAQLRRQARELEFERAVAGLRSILEKQPLYDEELHVFCTPDHVYLADRNGAVIDNPWIDLVSEADDDSADVDEEDSAMTTLITRSPRNIVIHDLNPDAQWPSFSETVLRLFEGRAHICDRCPDRCPWKLVKDCNGVRWGGRR
ncbi:sporulation protein YtxC [Alicyclobacillus acidiphilus]|uniref:sporulation protein YtxC n=1 Tax=Alicyclobacillus acidiphilus TaxID=182455 RepID=UPI0008341ACC|nr:sporulation protein YtxC [Alicyclobacillus acidiphilus]